WVIRSVVALLAVVAYSLWRLLCTRLHHLALCCPHCSQRITQALYQCQACQAEQQALAPNTAGLLTHRCTACHAPLPTLDFLGRKKLLRLCPACHHPLFPDLGSGVPIPIALIGAPASGKTSWLTSTLITLTKPPHQDRRKAPTLPPHNPRSL